jgi:hypothetical protein
MIVDISHNDQTPVRYYTLSDNFLADLQTIAEERGIDLVVTVIQPSEQFERDHYAIHQADAGTCAPCDKVRSEKAVQS